MNHKQSTLTYPYMHPSTDVVRFPLPLPLTSRACLARMLHRVSMLTLSNTFWTTVSTGRAMLCTRMRRSPQDVVYSSAAWRTERRQTPETREQTKRRRQRVVFSRFDGVGAVDRRRNGVGRSVCSVSPRMCFNTAFLSRRSTAALCLRSSGVAISSVLLQNSDRTPERDKSQAGIDQTFTQKKKIHQNERDVCGHNTTSCNRISSISFSPSLCLCPFPLSLYTPPTQLCRSPPLPPWYTAI